MVDSIEYVFWHTDYNLHNDFHNYVWLLKIIYLRKRREYLRYKKYFIVLWVRFKSQ